jgi:ribosomal protein L24E
MRFNLLAALFLVTVAHADTDPLQALFPHEYLGNIDTTAFTEPSGLTYHPGRGSLFVVSDEGQIAEFDLDGLRLQHVVFERTDFEGITCDPGTGLLYVAVEGAEQVIEFEPDGLIRRRTFHLGRTFDGQTVMAKGGQGIEGIAFAPAADGAKGGSFYIANQGFTIDSGDDRSVVCRFPLPPAGSAEAPLKAETCFAPGMIDIAGLFYDAPRQRLYLVSDSTNSFAETDPDGHLLQLYAFPGQAQEGIALDPQGHLYIAQDSGGIIKVRWQR